jgi:hypothetical protein
MAASYASPELAGFSCPWTREKDKKMKAIKKAPKALRFIKTSPFNNHCKMIIGH